MDDKTFLAYINATNKEIKESLYNKGKSHEERWDDFAHKSVPSFLDDGTTNYRDGWPTLTVVEKY